jgi:hypothetical protein
MYADKKNIKKHNKKVYRMNKRNEEKLKVYLEYRHSYR